MSFVDSKKADDFAGGGHHQSCEQRRLASECGWLRLGQYRIAAWSNAESCYNATSYAGQRSCGDDDDLYYSICVACFYRFVSWK
jgi:hypothetical protein